MRVGRLRGVDRCLAQQRDGIFRVTGLEIRDPGEIERVGLFGIDLEHLLVQREGVVDTAGLMQRDALLQLVGK